MAGRPSVLAERLTAQRLSGPPASDMLEATRHLLAVQAQDPRGARLAMRARTAGGRASDLDHAFTHERSLIVTWINRGTLHLVASEDEPLLHALTTPQLRTSSERRLRQEGVSEAAARRGIAAIVKALADGPLTRRQLRDVLDRAKVRTEGQALVHVLFSATLDGLILRGPMVGSEHAYVLAADWLGQRPKIDRGSALSELARRYLVGHAPADDRDLAKWAQLPLRDARAGLHAIASELEQRPDGLLALRKRAEPAPLPPPRLLGPYEPVLLGWYSREALLGDRVELVTINGLFRPFVLVRGRGAGIWSLVKGCVQLELWSEQPPSVLRRLEREATAVEEFLSS